MNQAAPECKQKTPPWVTTFADLSILLMCFFVLLLSFSELDAMKFKRLAGSMVQAFGVQSVMSADTIPKGTSIIAQEFSPGTPDPTPINEIWQKTAELTESSLEVQCLDTGSKNEGERGDDAIKVIIMDKLKDLIGETEEDAVELARALSSEIKDGLLEIETEGRKINIRVTEKGTFKSGSASMNEDFLPVLAVIRHVLAGTPGTISVEGHTDDIPIATDAFRSNWALSSARAVAVAHGLFDDGSLDEARFSVKGYGDTRPLVLNNTATNRAKNRRVEVVVEQNLDGEVTEQLDTLKKIDKGLYNEIREEFETQFNLTDDEIF